MVLIWWKGNREILSIVFVSLIFLTIALLFREFFFEIFLAKDLGKIVLEISLALTGFILTAYTIFLGLENQISRRIKGTKILDKIEQRFRISLYSSLALLAISLVFLFWSPREIAIFLLALLLFLVLAIFLLIGYLKLIFKDIRRN